MNTQLTTQVNRHVIIFIDKSRFWITEQEALQIFRISTDPKINKITIRGNYISLSGIAKILSREEFYDQYPNEKPAQTLPEFNAPAFDVMNNFEKLGDGQKNLQWIKSMIVGITRSIHAMGGKDKAKVASSIGTKIVNTFLTRGGTMEEVKNLIATVK